MYSLFAVVVLVISVQGIGPEWREASSVTTADKDAILKLAQSFGIDHPRTVSFDSMLPSGCPFVRVESPVEERDYRRTWRELLLRNRKWPRCFTERRSKRVGQWVASNAQLSTVEEWRIEDQGWYVDLRPGAGVSYEDVKLMVRAIHRGELINRLPRSVGPIQLNATLPNIDFDEFTTIEKSSGAAPRSYEVRTGKVSGLVFNLRIVDDKVELLSYGSWLS